MAMLIPMFKKYRKRPPRVRAAGTAPPPPPPAPTVSAAVFDEPSGTIDVIFDQGVTWDGSGHGTFQTSAGGGGWGLQVDPVTLRLYPDCGSMFEAGATWSWESPDGSLSPTPDPAQSGMVI